MIDVTAIQDKKNNICHSYNTLIQDKNYKLRRYKSETRVLFICRSTPWRSCLMSRPQIESGSIINRVHHVIINHHHHVSLANIHFNLHHDERKHLFAEWPRPRPGLGHKSGGACLGVPFYAPPPHPPPTNPHWPLPTQHVQCYVNSSIVGVNFMLPLALYSHPRTLLAGKEHLVSLKKVMKGGECPGQPYQPQSWSPFSMTYVI